MRDELEASEPRIPDLQTTMPEPEPGSRRLTAGTKFKNLAARTDEFDLYKINLLSTGLASFIRMDTKYVSREHICQAFFDKRCLLINGIILEPSQIRKALLVSDGVIHL